MTAGVAERREDTGGRGVAAIDDVVTPCMPSVPYSKACNERDRMRRTTLVVDCAGVFVALGLAGAGAGSAAVDEGDLEGAAEGVLSAVNQEIHVAGGCEYDRVENSKGTCTSSILCISSRCRGSCWARVPSTLAPLLLRAAPCWLSDSRRLSCLWWARRSRLVE